MLTFFTKTRKKFPSSSKFPSTYFKFFFFLFPSSSLQVPFTFRERWRELEWNLKFPSSSLHISRNFRRIFDTTYPPKKKKKPKNRLKALASEPFTNRKVLYSMRRPWETRPRPGCDKVSIGCLLGLRSHWDRKKKKIIFFLLIFTIYFLVLVYNGLMCIVAI